VKSRTWKLILVAAGVTIASLAWAVVAAGTGRAAPRQVENSAQQEQTGWKAPDPASIPKGPLGDSILLGLNIFRDTPQYAAKYTGNKLSCSDCHLQNGTAAYSSPMVGLPGLFPMYRERSGRVVTFADRINECMTRSQNGRPFPSRSPELVALIAYMQWLSQGWPTGKSFPTRGLVKLPALHGDAANGAKIYAAQCAVCHQANGAGIPPNFPPLWGPTSFNDGAGMSHVATMARFVQHAMPQTHPGSLTAQQAYDVSAYVDSQPRPKFDKQYSIY
jgi:thiosulfate dehydrogenase